MTRAAVRRTMLVCTVACLTGFTVSRPALGRETRRGPEILRIRAPGTTVVFELVRAPGGELMDGAGEPVVVGGMWVLTTEVTWDLYDVYLYALDEPEGGEGAGADAVTRPSKPYVPPDRGFGHAGYPAIGMTRHAAESFCVWLEAKTGIPARLPTPDEWTLLARGADIAEGWTAENAGGTTHPVGKKSASGPGLHDMIGNVAEWVATREGRPVAMGGSYRDAAEDNGPDSSQTQTSAWNTSDPQIPKSRWWLADCSWVGFRFVVDAEKMPAEILDAQNEEPADDE